MAEPGKLFGYWIKPVYAFSGKDDPERAGAVFINFLYATLTKAMRIGRIMAVEI